MADNTTQAGTDVIATDDVTALNGAASSGIKVQRVKLGQGVNNVYDDIHSGNPLWVRLALELLTTGTASGNVFAARSGAVGTTATSLQAPPAAGLSLYITDVSVSNSGATLAVVSFLPTGGTSFLDIVAAASGGGGSMNFRTPVKLAAATGLSVQSSAASTSLFATVTGYIAP